MNSGFSVEEKYYAARFRTPISPGVVVSCGEILNSGVSVEEKYYVARFRTPISQWLECCCCLSERNLREFAGANSRSSNQFLSGHK